MQVNELIKRAGSVEAAIDLIESVFPCDSDEMNISGLITLSVSHHSGISVEGIVNEDGKKNSWTRMVCYKLHQDLLKMSIRKIGKVYKRKENAVLRGVQRMDEIIENPKLDSSSYECFVTVKSNIEKAIKILNK